jgi:hypothetical protein
VSTGRTLHFLRLVDADPQTARGLIEAVGQLDGEAAIAAMADYGRRCGFELARQDLSETAGRSPARAAEAAPDNPEPEALPT